MKNNNELDYVNQLEREIKDLSFRINHSELARYKCKSIKNLKIFGNILRFSAPFVLMTWLTAVGVRTFSNSWPFYPYDKVKQAANIEIQIDNMGNSKEIQRFYSYNMDDKVLLYSKWNYNGERYERNVKEFSVKTLDQEEVKRIISSPQEIESLEKLFNSQYTERFEYTDSIDVENNTSYLEAYLYDVDNDNYIIINESADYNLAISTFFIALLPVSLIAGLTYRKAFSKYDYFERVDQINNDYNGIIFDKRILEKKLKLKKEDYNLLRK